MVRGDKSAVAEAVPETGGSSNDEGEEIDRIMKEIEDLEKKMDTEPEAASAPARDEPAEPAGAKVVSLRSATAPEAAVESLAETDAVPAPDEPLVREEGSSLGNGGLSLKVGGCTEVSLEFAHSGMTVSLSCSEEGLCITTDQGAEFRIPFKRSA